MSNKAIWLLLLSVGYAMAQQEVEIPTLLSLALTECLAHASIDTVFSQLANKNIYISQREFKGELTQAIERDPVRIIYERLPGDVKVLFSSDRNNYPDQIKQLTIRTVNSNGFIKHSQQYYENRAVLEELVLKCALLKVDCSSSLLHAYSDYDLIRLLLPHCSDVDSKDAGGKTALYHAVCSYGGPFFWKVG